MSCNARLLKFSLVIFNLVFLFVGIVCMGIGAWLSIDRYAIDSLASATARVKGFEEDEGLRALVSQPIAVRRLGRFLLFTGLSIVFAAFLGCCGASKEWRPALGGYTTCLLLIFVAESVAVIYASFHCHMFEDDFRRMLHASLRAYNGTDLHNENTDELFVKMAWDEVMIEKSCCGVEGTRGEFKRSGWYSTNGGSGVNRLGARYEFPPACCPANDKNGRLFPHCDFFRRHTDGCFEEMFYHNRFHFASFFGISIILSASSLIGLFMSVALFRRIRIEMLYYY